MKARVKATGEIVEIIDIDFDTLFCNNGGHYTLEQIEGIECDPDYWTRLDHQYAGMAMQGILGSEEIMKRINTMPIKEDQFGLVIAELSVNIAHALVEKYKKEEK